MSYMVQQFVYTLNLLIINFTKDSEEEEVELLLKWIVLTQW